MSTVREPVVLPLMSAVEDLRRTVARLRGPGGCPWDQEQTHQSLAVCLLEETCELLDTIDRLDMAHMREELGDVLIQVVFHAQLAEEKGLFDLEAVAAEINELLTPGLVYVSDTAPFAKALAHVTAPIVAGKNGANLPNVTLFSDLESTQPGPAVENAVASIRPDTIAKFLFTSGSTSLPKGVINTHGMLTANQQQSVQVWPFLNDDPMVLVDWLPWNHTFGSNYNFNLVLHQAGSPLVRPHDLACLLGDNVQQFLDGIGGVDCQRGPGETAKRADRGRVAGRDLGLGWA